MTLDLSLPEMQTRPTSLYGDGAPKLDWKLWIYTNYDCNLSCSYCVARSTPQAPLRSLDLETVQKVVDEAVELGFEEIFFTGGEPLILEEIYAMLAYASQRVDTTLLTNAMLVKGRRLEQLRAVQNERLTIQVSLDGGRAEVHDAYRGAGSWAATVAGIQRLKESGFNLRLSTTETPANCARLDEICTLHRSWGIPEKAHFIRPLARRGFSEAGIEVEMVSIAPEVTVNLEGIFWHPLSTDADMQVSKNIFPLAEAVKRIQEQLDVIANGGKPLITFT